MRKNILITGLPKSGKSSLLKKLLPEISNKTGFITTEIVKDGERTGFMIEASTGETAVLASIDFKTDQKVSRYSVNVSNLDSVLSNLNNFKKDDVLFIDEIGQMELFSDHFKQLALAYLDSTNICLATVSKVFKDEFIDQVLARQDTILVEINEENRASKFDFLSKLLKKISRAKSYAQKPEIFSFLKGYVVVNSEHGDRHVEIFDNRMTCDCNFFQENKICSHVLAVEEVTAKRPLNG